MVTIASVCIVPYLLIWATASSTSFTNLTEIIGERCSFDQVLLFAGYVLPLNNLLIFLSAKILQPLLASEFKIKLTDFDLLLCIKRVSVAPHILVFLNLAFNTILFAILSSASLSIYV